MIRFREREREFRVPRNRRNPGAVCCDRSDRYEAGERERERGRRVLVKKKKKRRRGCLFCSSGREDFARKVFSNRAFSNEQFESFRFVITLSRCDLSNELRLNDARLIKFKFTQHTRLSSIPTIDAFSFSFEASAIAAEIPIQTKSKNPSPLTGEGTEQ